MDQVYSISVLVLLVALALPFLSLIPNGKIRTAIGLLMLAVYVYGNLNETILGRAQQAVSKARWVFFWSYKACLSIQGGELRIRYTDILTEIILNILLYVPLGYILPFVLPKVFCPAVPGSRHHWVGLLRVMGVALLCSVATEIAQYFFRIGVFELDDIFNNTLGAGMGFVLYRIVMTLFGRGWEKKERAPSES